MKIALVLSLFAFLFQSQAQACSRIVDEEAIRKEMVAKVQESLYDTRWKVMPEELSAPRVLSFNVRVMGSSLERAAQCGDYEIFEAKVAYKVKRGSKSCDAVVTVMKTRGSFNGGMREEFFFEADVWPMCLDRR